MEGEKRGSEAGTSSEKLKELSEKLGEVCDLGEEEDEDDDEDHKTNVVGAGFSPGPLVSLKEQIEKDKDDESLRRWKEKLLGCLEIDLIDQMEPEVQFHSIGIISNDFGEINTPLPVDANQERRLLFTLKEGSEYRLKLTFSVLHNIVSGLTYSNTVWKGGLQVDQSKGMLGTFAPNREPYVHTLEEETTPSGVLVRGVYSAMLKTIRQGTMEVLLGSPYFKLLVRKTLAETLDVRWEIASEIFGKAITEY